MAKTKRALEEWSQPEKSSGKHSLASAAPCLGAQEESVNLDSCSSLGLLWAGLALEKSSALIFFVRSASAANSSVSAQDILAKVVGVRCDQSQQEKVIGRRQACGVTWGSASGLSYKVSSTNLHQYSTMGNLAAAGNGTGILVCLCLQGPATLCSLNPWWQKS